MNESSWGAPSGDRRPQAEPEPPAAPGPNVPPGRPDPGAPSYQPGPADQQETQLLPPVPGARADRPGRDRGGDFRGDLGPGFGPGPGQAGTFTHPAHQPQEGRAWGPPQPQAGHGGWDTRGEGLPPGAPATSGLGRGPAHGGGDGAQTRHMSPVAGAAPDPGRNDEEREAAARLRGPLFRDEVRPPSSTEETAILPPISSRWPDEPRRGPGPGNGTGPGNDPGQDDGVTNGNGHGNRHDNGHGNGRPGPRHGAPQPPPVPPETSSWGPGQHHPGHGQGHVHGQGPGTAPRQPEPPQPTPPPPGAAPAPRTGRAGRNLKAAIGVGLGLGAVIVASLFVFKVAFVGVVVVAVVVGLWELTTRLAERKQMRVPLVPLAVGGTGMLVAGYVRGAEGAWVAMALTALALLAWRMTESPDNYLRDVTAGIFAAFYVPFLATFVVLMLAADDGAWRVMTFLVLTVCSDTGAYAIGARFGRRKLAPRISPGKTREGLLGAIAFSMVAGVLCMELAVDGGTWWQGLITGLLVAVSATLGDLGESMIKRDLGIKDMGTLLPGHGGIMDRLDSLLPTAPVIWLLFVIFVGAG